LATGLAAAAAGACAVFAAGLAAGAALLAGAFGAGAALAGALAAGFTVVFAAGVVGFLAAGLDDVAGWAGVFVTEISSQRRLYPLCGVGSHPAAKLGRRGL